MTAADSLKTVGKHERNLENSSPDLRPLGFDSRGSQYNEAEIDTEFGKSDNRKTINERVPRLEEAPSPISEDSPHGHQPEATRIVTLADPSSLLNFPTDNTDGPAITVSSQGAGSIFDPFETHFTENSQMDSSQVPILSSAPFVGLENMETQVVPSHVDWPRIVNLRTEVWGVRSQIRMLRVKLRNMQRTKSGLQDKVFRRLALAGLTAFQIEILSQEQMELEELQRECQEATDAYGPVEDDCNQLEDLLSAHEFELTQLEQNYYSTVDATKSQQTMKTTGFTFPAYEQSESPSVAPREEGMEVSDYHPLVNNYLSRLGDLDILQERLDELHDEKQSLEDEKASRLRFGLTLDPQDQDWLYGAQAVEDETVRSIGVLKDEVEGLRDECLTKGLIDEDGEPTIFLARERDSFSHDEGVDPKDQTSEYVKYPVLLPIPGQKHQYMDFPEPKPDKSPDMSIRLINEWILEITRISPLDVRLLSSIYEINVGAIKVGWEFAVLSLWFQDSTVYQSDGRPRTASLDTQADQMPVSGSSDARPPRSLQILIPFSLQQITDISSPADGPTASTKSHSFPNDVKKVRSREASINSQDTQR